MKRGLAGGEEETMRMNLWEVKREGGREGTKVRRWEWGEEEKLRI